jgi:alcohol dehydrogenase (cytochrome c)
VLFANRNAFYYALDRTSGEFLVGKAYVKQTWAKGLDDSGRPILMPGNEPTIQGTKVWPSVSGSNNWYSPSYSPRTNLLYVAARESGSVYFLGEAEYKEGDQFNGGGFRSVPGEEEYGVVRAFHPSTGALAWEFRLFSPPWAGLLSTAGNLVFGSTSEGQAFALQASTGKPLWRYQTGGAARSNPMSYSSDGKQYVAMAIGNTIYAFGLD